MASHELYRKEHLLAYVSESGHHMAWHWRGCGEQLQLALLSCGVYAHRGYMSFIEAARIVQRMRRISYEC